MESRRKALAIALESKMRGKNRFKVSLKLGYFPLDFPSSSSSSSLLLVLLGALLLENCFDNGLMKELYKNRRSM